ncbi:protein kinase C delta type-like [Lithobates pipiens]
MSQAHGALSKIDAIKSGSNAGAIKDQLPAVLPRAGAMKYQSRSVAPITNVMWDKSYRLAMEKGFTFQKILGQGTFGKVMLASHPGTSKMLAVKIIEKRNYPYPSISLIEGRLLEQVRNNPFITHLYGSFQSKDQLVLVMEYLSGGDLSQLIMHSAPLPEDTIRNLTADILCGLEILHSKNIVHRDLKPANILLDDAGRAKIADLGLSKSGVSEQNRIRENCGTLLYMAPEVLQGIPYYTLVDYFSLGIIVYQMAVGKHPFWKGQKTPREILRALLSVNVYYPPQINPHLCDLIKRLLQIEQERRNIQVRDLRRHLFFKNFDWAKIQNRAPHPEIDFRSIRI